MEKLECHRYHSASTLVCVYTYMRAASLVRPLISFSLPACPGVVSALLTIVTFSLLTAVPASLDQPQNLPQKRAYGVITATALMCNLAR